MRRIQVSLNKDMGRLRRVVLTDRPATRNSPPPASASRTWSSPRPGTGCPGTARARHRLHIVDPQGRLIMDYPVDVAAKGMRADLDRLLKYRLDRLGDRHANR